MDEYHMNPRIWSHLPDHLLERVLSFLPLKTFLSLRSTCKHFNSLLFSPCFISKYNSSSSSSSPFSSFIVLSHSQFSPKCPIYNTVVNSWNSTSLSCPDPMLTCPPNSTLQSSSNGLLCFSMPRSSCFVVCNPLSRSLRRVKFPTYPFVFELLTLLSNPSGFKLFMVKTIGSSIKTLVYSSRSNTWQQFKGFDPMIINSTHDQKAVLYDNSLLFTSPENHRIVVGFDLETGKWEEKSKIRLPGSLTFARFASDGDRKLFLIGGVGVSGISRSIKLWELSEDGENWTEIETLPEMLCRKFLSVCYHNYQHVYCFWHQGLICVCCYTWPEVLYYKVSRRTWHWLPKCPSLPDKWSCGFKWFSFKPELYATV